MGCRMWIRRAASTDAFLQGCLWWAMVVIKQKPSLPGEEQLCMMSHPVDHPLFFLRANRNLALHLPFFARRSPSIAQTPHASIFAYLPSALNWHSNRAAAAAQEDGPLKLVFAFCGPELRPRNVLGACEPVSICVSASHPTSAHATSWGATTNTRHRPSLQKHHLQTSKRRLLPLLRTCTASSPFLLRTYVRWPRELIAATLESLSRLAPSGLPMFSLLCMMGIERLSSSKLFRVRVRDLEPGRQARSRGQSGPGKLAVQCPRLAINYKPYNLRIIPRGFGELSRSVC